jgi:hypothetical protein
MTLVEVYNVYNGSNAEATRALYARLELLGPIGVVAANLFRAHKTSARAKVYRGGERGRGSFKGMAYEKKNWALGNITTALSSAKLLTYGWAEDSAQEFHRWVLYVDLPTGQVSFHAAARGTGPDYAGQWDGSTDEGAGRICRWISQLLTAKVTA